MIPSNPHSLPDDSAPGRSNMLEAGGLNIEQVYATLREQIGPLLRKQPALSLIGIHSGGVWVAERLHRDLGIAAPLGSLSSAFHRDDYNRRGLPAEMKSTVLPFEIAGAHILLVDDILFTGRTVRAALNELFDYGRPASVQLAVLLDRGGRELPIEAQFCGAKYPLPKEKNFVLELGADHRFVISLEGES
jgi:pyrimidine operon attenuation protein / uracil phosphoribosyltransferase